MKAVISLSTSYLQSKFKGDGYAMLQEAAEMGFEYVELGHSTSINSVEGILRAINESVVKVSSLHNFCPLPPFAKGAAPNLFSPATSSKLESQQWQRHTKNTLEFASTTKASAVVCHCGRTKHFFFQPEDTLFKIRDSLDETTPITALAENKKYTKALEKFRKGSSARAHKSYKFIFENFRELFESDAGKNSEAVCCVENREDPQELPFDYDVEIFMEAMQEFPRLRLWHDVGHSRKKELMRLSDPLEYAEKSAPLLAGWHLHDCDDFGKDHIAIGKGNVNFSALRKFFDPQKHIFTLELNHAVKRQDAIDSRKRVEDML